MISHNSIREKIRETLPKTQRKNSQSLAALGVFMVDGTGLEPVTPCTSRNLPKTASNLCIAVGCGF